MDPRYPSSNIFRPGRSDTDQGIQQHNILKRPETFSPVRNGVLQDNSQGYNPGPDRGSWSSSHSGPAAADGSVMPSSQQPHHQPRYTGPTPYGANQSYPYSPSQSPEGLSLSNPHAFSSFNNNHPSSDLSPSNPPSSPTVIKQEPPPHGLPLDWPGNVDAVRSLGVLEPYYSSSSTGIGSHYQPLTQSCEPPTIGFTTSGPTPLSPTYSTTSYHFPVPASKTSSSGANSTLDHDDLEASPGSTDEEVAPYSKLIYMALDSVEEKQMPLQEIYAWFEKNTDKGRDERSKGWQNSIRHNLSMNQGFEAVKVESTTGKKATNFWRLTEEARLKGKVQSTTRYRKQANYRKAQGSDYPAPQRQRSGAKGGKATKIGAKHRGHPLTMGSSATVSAEPALVESSSSSADELLPRKRYCPQFPMPRQFTGHSYPVSSLIPRGMSQMCLSNPVATPMARPSADLCDTLDNIVGNTENTPGYLFWGTDSGMGLDGHCPNSVGYYSAWSTPHSFNQVGF